MKNFTLEVCVDSLESAVAYASCISQKFIYSLLSPDPLLVLLKGEQIDLRSAGIYPSVVARLQAWVSSD
jgi:hypothetical protein